MVAADLSPTTSALSARHCRLPPLGADFESPPASVLAQFSADAAEAVAFTLTRELVDTLDRPSTSATANGSQVGGANFERAQELEWVMQASRAVERSKATQTVGLKPRARPPDGRRSQLRDRKSGDTRLSRLDARRVCRRRVISFDRRAARRSSRVADRLFLVSGVVLRTTADLLRASASANL